MAGKKYLIVYRKWASVVPLSVRDFVKKKIQDEFSKFDLELDFSDSRPARDLVVTFSNEIPGWPAYGESSRIRVNNELGKGESTIYVRSIMAMRLETTAGSCESAFPDGEATLGLMVANTTIHETGHMLGMDTGGYDDGGHSTDSGNYMWDPGSMPHGDTHVGRFFEYTVKSGDTLSGIVWSYRHGKLSKCRFGSNDLTYQDVWNHPENKKMGFVAHPTKSGIPGRRANDPNFIYPGEKVALINDNFRTQKYRLVIAAFLGKKSFTEEQIKTMKDFIAQQIAAGKG
jgi:hypothetical protein